MRSSPQTFAPRKSPLIDVIAAVLLGFSLCFSLIFFVTYRLSARDWWPLRFGLSENGDQYVSLSAAGMRVHDVATGKELDRIELRGPWRDLLKSPDNGVFHIHPLDDANAESFRHGEWFSDDGEGYWDTRPRMQVSPSRRYVTAVFPAGYLILWDRQRHGAQLVEMAEYFLRTVSFDEQKDVLIVETIPRPEHLPEKQRELQADTRNAGLPIAISALAYRLDSLTLDSTTVVPDAGEPINGDRNYRCIDDELHKEFRIAKWSDFPNGTPQIVHRVAYTEFPNAVNDPWLRRVRVIDGRLDLITFDGNSVRFRTSPGVHPTHRSQLPQSMQERALDWLANGSASFADGAISDYQIIATWSVDGTLAAYGFPDEFTAAAALPVEADGRRLLRVAADEGQTVDLPIGTTGEIRSNNLDLNVFPNLPHQMSGAVIALGACWCVYAWRRKCLFSSGGWLVLSLLAIWLSIFWGIELQMSRATHGFLIYSIIWISLVILAAICGVLCFLKGDLTRAGVVFVCALFALLLLCEIPSRQTSDQGRTTTFIRGF